MGKGSGGGGRGGGKNIGPTIGRRGKGSDYAVSNMTGLAKGGKITTGESWENSSVFSLEKILRPRVDKYGRIPNAELNNAIRIVRTDGTIRSKGKPMKAKFPGKDAATGEKFPAGIDIIYRGDFGAVVANRTKSSWLK